jgi:hypothetical protein
LTDSITLLRATSGARMTKMWRADGTIAGYDNAKTFKHTTKAVGDLKVLSEVLQNFRSKSDVCAIRGTYPAGAGAQVQRNTESTVDTPHRWLMIDVDDYEPLAADPVADPAAACAEFILDRLPPEFHDRSFYWHLSSSAGKDPLLLKCHTWFWLESAVGSAPLRAWAKGRPGIDPAVFNQVQIHYTADPVFEAGVADPVVRRAGLVEGLLGDEVPVSFLGDVSVSSSGDFVDAADIDIGLIRSPVAGYDLGRVRDEVLAHLDPDMGYEDWLQVGMALHHQFDGDPEALELWDEWSSDGATWREGGCAEHWGSFRVDRMVGTGAVTLGSLLKKVRPAAIAVASEQQPGAGRADVVLATLARRVAAADVSWFERAISWSADGFEDALSRMAWDTTRGRFCILPVNGSVVEAAKEDLATVMHERELMGFLDLDALEELAKKAIEPGGPASANPPLSAKDQAAWVKVTVGLPLERMRKLTLAHRQFVTMGESVDLFAKTGRIHLRDRVLTLVFPHETLPEDGADAGLLADYQAHFPALDDYLDLMVSARLANDRKRAHLWLHATSNWGKGFLTGMLQRLGLVATITAEELTTAVAGGPVGLTPEVMRRAWVLAIDEFKGVTREMKMLGTELSFSPKNRPRVTVPLFLKQFMSAEDVPSLVSEDSGADVQFANRFMRMRGVGSLDDRVAYAGATSAYGAAVRSHIAAYVNRRVSAARVLGASGAAAAADAQLARLHARYPLSSDALGSLDDRLPEIAAQFVSDMKASATSAVSPIQRIARDNTLRHNGEAYLVRGDKALESWLHETYSKSEAGKIYYKRRQILELVGTRKTVNLGGDRHKAIPLGTVTGVADELFA